MRSCGGMVSDTMPGSLLQAATRRRSCGEMRQCLRTSLLSVLVALQVDLLGCSSAAGGDRVVRPSSHEELEDALRYIKLASAARTHRALGQLMRQDRALTAHLWHAPRVAAAAACLCGAARMPPHHRQLLLKISVAESLLIPLPKDTTFRYACLPAFLPLQGLLRPAACVGLIQAGLLCA
jgi:hypothetical protein